MNFKIFALHDFTLECTCEVFVYNSTWLASCVVIPIFITVLSPTLLSSHASPEGFQPYYHDFQPQLCKNTAFTVISLTNAPFLHPWTPNAHLFMRWRRSPGEVTVLITEQNHKLGKTLKKRDAGMQNLQRQAVTFESLVRNLDRVTQWLFFFLFECFI